MTEFYASKKSDLWYTPTNVLDLIRYYLKGIELDPASDQYGNSRVQAERYFTQEQDGLSQSWIADSIFCNPPFSLAKQFSNKMIHEFQIGNFWESILLVNACTSEKWFQPLYNYPILFTNRRIKFDRGTGDKGQANTKGQALVLFSHYEDALEDFVETFKDLGTVIQKVKR